MEMKLHKDKDAFQALLSVIAERQESGRISSRKITI